MNLLAKVGYNLAKVIPFGETSNDLAKPLYNLAKPYTFWQKSVVSPNCIRSDIFPDTYGLMGGQHRVEGMGKANND